MPAVPPAAAVVFAPLVDPARDATDAPPAPCEHEHAGPAVAECAEIETCC